MGKGYIYITTDSETETPFDPIEDWFKMQEDLDEQKEKEKLIERESKEDSEESAEEEDSEYVPESDSDTTERNFRHVKKRKYKLRRKTKKSKKSSDPSIQEPKRIKIIFPTSEVGESSKGPQKPLSPPHTMSGDMAIKNLENQISTLAQELKSAQNMIKSLQMGVDHAQSTARFLAKAYNQFTESREKFETKGLERIQEVERRMDAFDNLIESYKELGNRGGIKASDFEK